MLQLMFELQPDQVMTCLTANDITNMTPLHKAALFDRSNCVTFLIQQVESETLFKIHGSIIQLIHLPDHCKNSFHHLNYYKK